jgi:hypothetical protein
MSPVLTHRSRPPLAGDAPDAADADPIPEWFSNFLNDRQTRKPSAHTMTRRLRGRRPCEISHRTRSRTSSNTRVCRRYTSGTTTRAGVDVWLRCRPRQASRDG